MFWRTAIGKIDKLLIFWSILPEKVNFKKINAFIFSKLTDAEDDGSADGANFLSIYLASINMFLGIDIYQNYFRNNQIAYLIYLLVNLSF